MTVSIHKDYLYFLGYTGVSVPTKDYDVYDVVLFLNTLKNIPMFVDVNQHTSLSVKEYFARAGELGYVRYCAPTMRDACYFGKTKTGIIIQEVHVTRPCGSVIYDVTGGTCVDSINDLIKIIMEAKHVRDSSHSDM